MPLNQALRDAIALTGKSREQVAADLNVVPKTLQRWVNEGRIPPPDQQIRVAAHFGKMLEDFWPPEMGPATDEVQAVWGMRTEAPVELWRTLFRQATTRIDCVAYAMQFVPEIIPSFADMMIDKAASGCVIRFAFGDPDSQVVIDRSIEEGLGPAGVPERIRSTLNQHFAPLYDIPGIEIGTYVAPMYNSVFRLDDQMLMTQHLYGTPGYRAPLWHLRRHRPGGPFDRFAHHAEQIIAITSPYHPGATSSRERQA